MSRKGRTPRNHAKARDSIALLDTLEFAAMMDMLTDPSKTHWADCGGDRERARVARSTAQCVAEKTGWTIAADVSRWRIWLLTQAQLATAIGMTGRHVQNLEAKGLPSEGERDRKRYAWPDAWAWYTTYVALTPGPHDSIEWLEISIARARFDLRRAADWIRASELAYGPPITGYRDR
jgi:hypothetical protein